MKLRRTFVLVAVLVLVLLMEGGAAFAAYPGENGGIAFTDRRDGDAEIYTVKSNGSSLTKLTSNAADDFSSAFSPTARR